MPQPGRRAPPRHAFRRESDLYEPVKRFLERLGYEVKGEVGGCDVLAVRAGAPEAPLVVELKLTFTLALVLQGVDRLAVTDLVYLALPAAVERGRRTARSPANPEVRRLCRRLGLGLLAVHPAQSGGQAARVEVVGDPCPPARVPRKNQARANLLLGEHARRQGDPNRGGTGGQKLLTAYRQAALRCAGLLQQHGGGPLAVASVRAGAAAPAAGRILYRNVYGWFEPAGRGRYRLTEAGARDLAAFVGTGGETATVALG